MSRLTRVAQIRLLAQRRPTVAKSQLQGQHHPMGDPSQLGGPLLRMVVPPPSLSLGPLHHMVVIPWNQLLELPLHMGRVTVGRVTVLVPHLQFLPQEDSRPSALLPLSAHPLHTFLRPTCILLAMHQMASIYPVLVHRHQCLDLLVAHSRHPLV